MSQPALASSSPAPFLRRGFDWWLAQVKHALPPTIFFFIGFNLILWTKRLILEEHGASSAASSPRFWRRCWSEKPFWRQTTCPLCAALTARH